MSNSAESQYARSVLRLEIWGGPTDYNAALRAGAAASHMSVGSIERGLLELARLGHITRSGNNYTITPAGRTAREALLAK